MVGNGVVWPQVSFFVLRGLGSGLWEAQQRGLAGYGEGQRSGMGWFETRGRSVKIRKGKLPFLHFWL